MKWVKKDIEQFKEIEEFVDTIILPLVPFDFFGKEAAKKALQNEIMTIYVNEIEQKLKGRIIQFPHYTYLAEGNIEEEVSRINDWIIKNEKEHIKHILLLTFDSSWRKYEADIKGTLLWVPAMYSGNIYSEEVSRMMSDQINELISLIQSYW